MADRAFQIHTARVYLRECRARRHNPADRNFYWRLLAWAQGCRRDAAMSASPAAPEPAVAAQLELFAAGGAA